MMKRLLYLGYYLKNLDKPKYKKFLDYVSKKENKSKTSLRADIISSALKYNVSILEYFQFGFYKLSPGERKKYAGTGYMYEYQLQMNPKDKRNILDDKRLFYKQYKEFVLHANASLDELKADNSLAEKLLNSVSGKVVLKVSDGKCGAQVIIVKSAEHTPASLIQLMEKEGYDLAEEYIIQHPDIMALSPSAVNTVRIFTQLNEKDEVELLGCRLRISINSHVDNLAAGNIAAPIDDATGIISGPGVYSDITKSPESVHPVTGVKITGFQIPFWRETIEMIKKAAKAHPENRSIGWDIVITDKGPGLIEGNHDWCKLVWQLPVNKGMKPILEKHLSLLQK
ncbi:MAG: hexapeptide transferase [Bacteroidetes bacterium]|nr:hexapeptide transferase [Bacteroidota bacterium]